MPLLSLLRAVVVVFFFGLGLFAPLARAQPATQSLAGEWRFALDRSAEQRDVNTFTLNPGEGVEKQWFARELPGRDKIKLPGVLQAQGYGNDIALDTPWVVALGDAWWKLQPAELREKFSQPGKVEVPFLAQPPKHYLGAAWYQREIEIPASAGGRRFELFLERAHWETTVWIDDKKIGSDRSLVAPHMFDLGRLAPGKHRLTIRVDNRQIVRDPQNDGHGVDAHAVSDALGATWNGIVGKIELRSTSPVWIEDVQVFSDVTKKSATVRVSIGNGTNIAGTGSIRIEVGTPGPGVRPTGADARAARPYPISWSANGGAAEPVVPLGDLATWDEFNPTLHRLSVVLDAGNGVTDTREVTFGFREVSWREHDFLVNGRVVNLRTTHFGLDFPLTGHPAMDVESWEKIIRRCQEFGLNGIRFHSCCPPEAAFTAADELGFYLQPELGLWAPFNPGSPYTVFLEEETLKLLKAYGNHPSFVMFSPSNEPAGRYTQITPQWAAAWHKVDPRRLYSAGTGWNRPEQVTGGAQFAGLVRFGRGELRNVTGWFGNDFRVALEGVNIPVLAHEIGQWCAYPDFDVIKKFTGYLRPSNYDIFRYIAEQEGVAPQNRELAWASGKFQLACYKEELEANLRTPGLAGHQMLDIRDYLGQGTALIGVLDAFWEPKSYVTAQEFRRFHSETVPLARLKQRTFTTADTLTAETELYHFGAKPIAGAKPQWKIVRVDAARLVRGGSEPRQNPGSREPGHEVVARGEWPARDIPIGKNHALGEVSVALAKLPAPGAYKLVVGLAGSSVENDWNFWLYPAEQPGPSTPPVGVLLITSSWPEAEARLAAGGKVLFTPTAANLDPAKSPPLKRVPIFWNIQMTVRPPRNLTPRFDAMLGLAIDAAHGALAQFPTDKFCDFQWTPLIDNVRSVNLREAPRDLQPIVAAIDDWNRNWRLGVIFEAGVGAGKLLVCTIPLKPAPRADAATAASVQQLRRSLVAYAAGETFRPVVALTAEQAKKLFAVSATPSAAPAQRAFDADLDDGSGKKAAAPAKKTP